MNVVNPCSWFDHSNIFLIFLSRFIFSWFKSVYDWSHSYYLSFFSVISSEYLPFPSPNFLSLIIFRLFILSHVFILHYFHTCPRLSLLADYLKSTHSPIILVRSLLTLKYFSCRSPFRVSPLLYLCCSLFFSYLTDHITSVGAFYLSKTYADLFVAEKYTALFTVPAIIPCILPLR